MGALFRGVLHFRMLVIGLALGVLAVGVLTLRDAPADALPEFTPTYAEVQTEALGLSANEVEQLITVPLEADLLNGVEGVEVIRSQSLPGLSSIVMVFARGTDVYRARQLVEERLTQAHALPNVSKPPTLLAPVSSSNRVLMIGLSSTTVSPIEQSVIARWTVRPRLMGVPGVANVSIWGMRDQQLQVQVDPERLRAAGVTLSQVVRSAGNAQVVSPLSFLEASTPGTGGFIETPQQRLQVRHLLERIADPAELGKVPVSGTNGRLKLADVSTIVVDHQPLIGDAVVDGEPGLLLVVEKFPGAGTGEVAEAVEDAVDDLRPGLTGIRTDMSLFSPAQYLDDAGSNVRLAVGIGLALLLVVLLACRLGWRGLVVVLATVPLSVVTALLLLHLSGQGLNVLVVAGLAAAVTVLVDEAVVASERVATRLRSRMQNGGPVPVLDHVRHAVEDIRTPLIYASLVGALAVVPVLVMAGRPGAFFAPLAWAYLAAVVAAVVVALVVAPVLLVLLFSIGRPDRSAAPVPPRVQVGYGSLLQRFGRTVRVPALVATTILLVGAGVLAVVSPSLVPQLQDRAVLVRLEAPPGTSNPQMTRAATDLSRTLQDVPGVARVAATIGRAVTGDRVVDVSSSDVWVRIASGADYGATVEAIEAAARDVKGVRHDVITYSSQKVKDVGGLVQGDNPATGGIDLLTGVGDPLVVRLFGQDPEVLREQAAQVKAAMAGVDGVVNPRIDLPPTEPTIEIEVDLERAQALGVTPGDVRRASAILLQGIQVGSVFQEQKVFDVIVQGAPDTRESVEDVGNLLIDRPGGGHLRLGDAADVRVTDDVAVIERDAVSRRIDVTADVRGRDLAAVSDEVRAQLSTMSFPIEYHAEVLEQSTERELGLGRVAGFAVAALVAVFLLLQAAFRSWRWAALVFAMLPLALVGGLLAAPLAGAGLALGALLGCLAVLCLAARTTILLAARVQALAAAGGDHAEGVRAAAQERLAPVLATSLSLAAAGVPFVVLGPRPGLELLHQMAVVLLGGLVSTTFVTLVLLPSLLVHVPPRREPGLDAGLDGHRTIDLERPVDQPLVPESVPAQRTDPVHLEDPVPAGEPGP